MIKEFNELPNTSKVWVYQYDKMFTKEQKEYILLKGKEFIETWKSHGASIPASINIFYSRFIVITADDCGENLCGRAKDAQVRLVKQIETDLNIILTNRMLTAYKEKNEIITVGFNKFKDLVKQGKIKKSTIVYNNIIDTKQDFITNWETTVENSWHNQFIN